MNTILLILSPIAATILVLVCISTIAIIAFIARGVNNDQF